MKRAVHDKQFKMAAVKMAQAEAQSVLNTAKENLDACSRVFIKNPRSNFISDHTLQSICTIFAKNILFAPSDRFVFAVEFAEHLRIQTKTSLTPLEKRRQAVQLIMFCG